MAEREIVQGVLSGCNPCIACMLRSTVITISKLVQLRTLEERDFHAVKAYQKQQVVSAQQEPSKEGESRWVFLLCLFFSFFFVFFTALTTKHCGTDFPSGLPCGEDSLRAQQIRKEVGLYRL